MSRPRLRPSDDLLDSAGGCSVVVQKVTYCYKATPDSGAIGDISLDIGSGERLAIVGSSGSGKSTLLKIISGMFSPDSGSVSLTCGREKPRVSMLMQGESHLPWLTVKGNLMLATRSLGLSKRSRVKAASEALEKVGLSLRDLGTRYLSQLSGGQARRVELSMALMNEPHLLCLDEPTTGLDYESADSVRVLIDEAVSLRGATMILVTHHLEEAVRLSGRIAVLKRGSLSGMHQFGLGTNRASSFRPVEGISDAIMVLRSKL